MENNTVTISTSEYVRLLERSIRVDIFAQYVNKSQYSIDREKCGDYLGFEVKEDGAD